MEETFDLNIQVLEDVLSDLEAVSVRNDDFLANEFTEIRRQVERIKDKVEMR